LTVSEGLIHVYRAAAPDAPALPGWTFPVDDLFE